MKQNCLKSFNLFLVIEKVSGVEEWGGIDAYWLSRSYRRQIPMAIEAYQEIQSINKDNYTIDGGGRYAVAPPRINDRNTHIKCENRKHRS